MNDKRNNRGRKLFANKMHWEIFFLIFCAAMIPTIITAIGLFYLFFSLIAEQLGIPEAIIYNLFPVAQKVFAILSVVVPLSILIILILAHKLTHRIVGPFDRIIRELGEVIEGKRQGPIILRKKDKFWPLVDRINIILSKLQRH